MTLQTISICGASGAGKSTLANRLFHLVREYGFSASIVELDSWLYSKPERKQMGILHGYSYETYHLPELKQSLDSLILRNEQIYCRKYNHSTGTHSKEMYVILPADFIIIDGVISLYQFIRDSYSPFGIFIDVPEQELVNIKKFADENHGYSAENTDAEIYKKGYIDFCLPQKKYADIVLEVTFFNNFGRGFKAKWAKMKK